MSSNQSAIQTGNSSSDEVTRSMAKSRVALRNGEADQIVEALRWYARQEITPRKQAQCERLATMLESGFDI
jgi:hypothetical protein